MILFFLRFLDALSNYNLFRISGFYGWHKIFIEMIFPDHNLASNPNRFVQVNHPHRPASYLLFFGGCVDFKSISAFWKSFFNITFNLFSRWGKTGHVVNQLRKVFFGAFSNRRSAFTASGIAIKGILVSGRTKHS